MQRPVRVLIVDDHADMRDVLAEVVATDPALVVAGVAGSGEEALEICAACAPDVVLIDASMPGMGGVEAVRRILGVLPAVHVLAISAHGGDAAEAEMAEAGAAGYLLKGMPVDGITAAIRAAAG